MHEPKADLRRYALQVFCPIAPFVKSHVPREQRQIEEPVSVVVHLGCGAHGMQREE
jgi:hypothetical protein